MLDAFEQADQLADVRGKTGQVLGQILRIADVRKGLLEKRHLRSVPARQVEPAAHHEATETQQLQQHGLSAGVGAGNHQHGKIFFKHDVIRHDLLLGQWQQGMPRVPQANVPVRVEPNRCPVHAGAQARLGSNTIQGGQDLQQAPQIIQVPHNPAREFLQDAIDFPRDLKLGDLDLIVQVDEFTGLHEHRGAAG